MVRDLIDYVRIGAKERFKRCKERGGFDHIFHKAAIVVALVLWLIAAGRAVVKEYKSTGKEEIITAFNSDAYSDMEAVISTYGKYGNINITDSAKKLILEDIARQIGVEDYSITDSGDDNTSVKMLCKDSVNGSVVCRFITVGEIPEAECNQYISIEITLADAVEAAFSYEEKISDIVSRLDMNSDVTVNLKGEIPGRLSNGMKDILADNMIGEIGANIVTQNRQEELFTLYAYDRDIDDYIKLGKDKVNVNLSIAYDELEDVTCVYLSTPINNSDY